MSAQPIRIGVAGAAGKMGREIISAIYTAVALSNLKDSDKPQLSTAVEAAGHSLLGENVLHPMFAPTENVLATGAKKLEWSDGKKILLSDSFDPKTVDVFIDFSTPSAAVKLTQQCRKHGIAMVIGATGFNESEMKILHDAADDIAMVVSPNMSVGVNAMFSLAADAVKLLRAGAWGGGYDIEINESHHRRKKDAPSGTALRLGEIAAEASGVDFSQAKKVNREGRDNERSPLQIGFSAIRGGDIVGEHRLIFAGDGEQLEIVHRSTSRAIYAAGAVRAALFAARANPGWHNMQAVLDS